MQQLKFNTSKAEKPEEFTGQACPLPGKGGMGSTKGAMGSAIVTIIL